jgi:hypothetical protein
VVQGHFYFLLIDFDPVIQECIIFGVKLFESKGTVCQYQDPIYLLFDCGSIQFVLQLKLAGLLKLKDLINSQKMGWFKKASLRHFYRLRKFG